MLKKVIKFNDLDGNPVEREYYFNLNKAEILKLQLGIKGGLEKMLETISNTKDFNALFNFISNLVLMSYGEKDADGIKFIKKKDGHNLCDEFEQSDAFSELMIELTNDIDAFNAFLTGIMPKDVVSAIATTQIK